MPDFTSLGFYLKGLWYSGTVLAILGCHEMGHYLACRYYRVDVSLPFFLPRAAPAHRHVRRVHPHPRAHPVEDCALRHRPRRPDRRLRRRRADAVHGPGAVGDRTGAGRLLRAVELGEPLLFRAAAWLVWGDLPDGMSINMHPMAFAAWFGLLATALNLFPAGQLDGGHVAYAVLGRRSTQLTHRDGDRGHRPDRLLDRLARLDGPDGADGRLRRARASADARRPHAARPRAPDPGASSAW